MNTGEPYDSHRGYEDGGEREKRFSMNYQDFMSQQGTIGGDAKDKRLSANRLDALAVPISGYWDIADDPDQVKRVASDWRSPTKRFSMNYMDFKDQQKKQRGKKKPKRFSMNYQDLMAPRGRGDKMNQKRFTMNFQDMQQQQQQPEESSWPDEEAEGGRGPAEFAVLSATTTAQTEDTKRAPPSPPTESALDMGGGRRRGKQLLAEKNLQSARRVFGIKG